MKDIAKANEMLTKAQNGDEKAKFNTGVFFMQQEPRDFEKGRYWYEEALKEGHKKGCQIQDCGYNLLLSYLRDSGIGEAETVNVLEKLAYTYNDYWGKITLGSLYCGSKHVMLVSLLETASFSSYKNLKKGITLIEEGVAIGKKFLDYDDYNMISGAYHICGGHKNADNLFDIIQKLKKAIEYHEKVLELSPPKYLDMNKQLMEAYKKQLADREAQIK